MSVSFEKIQEIVADALYVDKEEVTKEASLMADLGAESIDFLDIIFRLEKEFNVKIPKGEIENKAKGGLSDEEFALNGVIQPKGIEQLKKALPEAGDIPAGLAVRDISTLFTAATFERMVADQLGVTTSTDAAAAQPATLANQAGGSPS